MNQHFALFFFVIGTGIAFGAQTNEMVVTATGMAEGVGTVPASVTVLNRTDVEMLANRNIDNALRSVRGVSVLSSMGMAYAMPSQINIRGIPGLYSTLLMLDGFPLNEAGSGFISINEIPVASVRSVEVVRGPFSALYGSDALGGVVNIMTLSPDYFPSAEASVSVGNESFLEGSFRGSVGTESLGWTVQLNARTIDNYLAHDEIFETVYDPSSQQMVQRSRPAIHYDYKDRRVLFQLWNDIGESARHRLQLRYFESEGGYGQTDLAPYYPVPIDDTIDNRTLFAGSDLEWDFSETLHARLRSFVRGQQRTVHGASLSHFMGQMPVFVPSTSDTDSLDFKVDATLNYILDWQTLTVGGDVYHNQSDFAAARSKLTGERLFLSQTADESIVNVGLYLQDKVKFSESWSAVAGVRADIHSEFGEAVSPKVGLLYQVTEETRIRTSVGRAFRAPTLTELFQPTIQFGSIRFQADPDLDPEYVTSYDLEVEQDIGDMFTATAAVFYNDMKDLVVKRVEGTTLTFQNSDSAWSRGLELGLAWTPMAGVTAFVNGTLQESHDGDTGEDLDHTPENMLNAGLQLDHRFGRWRTSLAIAGHRVGVRGYLDTGTATWQKLEAYWRADTSLRVTWNNWIWLGLTADNLTDEQYQEWAGINPAPGRLWVAELGVHY